MNVDEAIARISKRLLMIYSEDDFQECREALDFLRAHVERKVDDAMVERALDAFYATQNWRKYAAADRIQSMKAALVAALGVEGA